MQINAKLITKFLNWKDFRRNSWFIKNKPFNPKEQWRSRKCRLAAPVIKSTQFSIGPTILLKQNNVFSSIGKNHNFKILTPGSADLCNFSWNIPPNQHPAPLSVVRWINSTLSFVGKRVAMRLRYKGKSFRWHRKLKSVLLRFGHSHIVIVKPKPNIRWRKHGRMKIIFFGTNLWYMKQLLQRMIKWRPMNVYHGRGLRLIQQKVLRKSGKVSAYR